jgi:hypothetical protein
MNSTHRSIIESPLFETQLAEIDSDVRHTDLVQQSFCFEVSTRPESFPNITGTTFRFLRTQANLAGCPSMWVYFTIDGPHHCTLQVVLVAEDQPATSIFQDR